MVGVTYIFANLLKINVIDASGSLVLPSAIVVPVLAVLVGILTGLEAKDLHSCHFTVTCYEASDLRCLLGFQLLHTIGTFIDIAAYLTLTLGIKVKGFATMLTCSLFHSYLRTSEKVWAW